MGHQDMRQRILSSRRYEDVLKNIEREKYAKKMFSEIKSDKPFEEAYFSLSPRAPTEVRSPAPTPLLYDPTYHTQTEKRALNTEKEIVSLFN